MPKDDFTGIIIEESLSSKSVLKKVHILTTKVERVTPSHHTPHLSKWTLHTVSVPASSMPQVAEEISRCIDTSNGTWYADFKNEHIHYIVFPHKIFKVNRNQKSEYEEATNYGISIGIPSHQVDFSPHVKVWKR